MAIKQSIIDEVEQKTIEAISILREVSAKQFNKWMKASQKAKNKKKKAKYFDRALNAVQKSEAIIEHLETHMAAIKTPWSAEKASKNKKRKK